jgi:hypothetical protein
MNELDEAAWERWVAYRVAIRKPIKTASEHAMKLKLSRYGADQDAVVNQSISNQWQGLFELKDKKKPDRPQKSPEQRAADDAMFIAAQDRASRGWDRQEPDKPIETLRCALGAVHSRGRRRYSRAHGMAPWCRCDAPA